VYFAVRDSTKVVGLLKIGVKKLFIQTPTVSTSIYQRSSDTGQVAEISPTSVLDFYVHESCQRQGWGKKLFEYFLWSEKKSPARLSYDRPSSKLLKFLEKHYALRQYTPQTNNFVVFHKYFEKSSDFHDKLIPKQCPDVFSSAKEKHTKNGGQRGSAGAKADDGDEVGSATPTTSTDGDFEGPSSSSSRFGHGAVGSKGTKSGAVGGSSIAEKVVASAASGVGASRSRTSELIVGAEKDGGTGSPEAGSSRGGTTAPPHNYLPGEAEQGEPDFSNRRGPQSASTTSATKATYGKSPLLGGSSQYETAAHFTRPAYVHYRDRQRQSSGVGNLLKTHHQPAGAGAGGGFVGGKDHPLRAPARTVYGSDYDSGAAGVAPGKLLQATGDGAPAATSTSKRTSDNMLSQQRRFNQLIESNLKTHNSSRTIL